ncbi:MAG: response regulator transcription factor [Candidatus Omnitrophica bacterium]|nr:response regulator transcription factor [Candidatus Omnitrophota bacterium]
MGAQNKRILVVDDDKDFLDELGEILTLAGYDMVTVNDSRKVFEVLKKEGAGLILLDLNMPQKNGFQVAFDLSNSQEFKGIPIIAMTGMYKTEIQFLLELCGVHKCLQKPFYPLNIITEIEQMLPPQQSDQVFEFEEVF